MGAARYPDCCERPADGSARIAGHDPDKGHPEAREASPGIRFGLFWTAIATSVMLIWSIFTPWAVVWGSIPVAIALIGWFWPKGTPEDES